jgi:hypothetical protein
MENHSVYCPPYLRLGEVRSWLEGQASLPGRPCYGGVFPLKVEADAAAVAMSGTGEQQQVPAPHRVSTIYAVSTCWACYGAHTHIIRITPYLSLAYPDLFLLPAHSVTV